MEKLKEVVKYLTYLSGKKPHRLNKVKLTKLLWLFEGIIYVRTGERPLGLRYTRNKHGLISSDVSSALIEFWNMDRKQAKEQTTNDDNHLILRAINIPAMNHLSVEEVALLSMLYNLLFAKGKSPIDDAMANLPSLDAQKNLCRRL